MSRDRIAVLGECVADAFVTGTAPGGGLALRVLPGGGPANTAVALARLGTPVRFLGRISRDPFGELFRAHLDASGVDLTGCVSAQEPSVLAVATLDEAGRAAYSFHAEGAADWRWSAAELTGERVGDAVCLHTGSLALVHDPGAGRIEELLARAAAGATVSIDPNVRPGVVPLDRYREAMPRWCALADVVKLSLDDLELIRPGETAERACDAWHAAGARLVVVTLGPGGALVSLDGLRVRVPAPAVRVVDTVGAGDSFTAAFLHRLRADGLLGGRLDALDLDAAGRAAAFAAGAAARTCSVPGADPPWAGDL
ncbi:carbohydrate kinase [Streptosporangium sp. NPDC020145]|uniref:carbohydrate kinase family protein n=1 Tax=Streptosporangium sp. NPDC020145 TaxID=3154694 RepID=UPI00342AA1E2